MSISAMNAAATSALALGIYGVFLLLTFGWRAWIQYRSTGDHGFRGFSGSSSRLERLAGVLFAVSMATLPATAVLVMSGVILTFDVTLPATLAGVTLMIGGLVLIWSAQHAMGETWRVGVDPRERTELVRHGLFAVVRNPVFSAIALHCVGFALLVPSVMSLVGLALGAVAIELQVRRIEEPHLLRVHGGVYGEYARRVGRFVPWVGRLG